MTPTNEMPDAPDEPFQAFKTVLFVELVVLFPLAMAAWLLK
jgi:hypothetical protein